MNCPRYLIRIILIVGILLGAGCASSSETITKGPSYQVRREAFSTTLLDPGPAPQMFGRIYPPPNVKEITYTSGDLELKAWVHTPDEVQSEPRPALIYHHVGFSFSTWEIGGVRPFMDAGYVVKFPMQRDNFPDEVRPVAVA